MFFTLFAAVPVWHHALDPLMSVGSACRQILSEVRDIEQLVTEGRRRKACPYYASRRAVRDAQVSPDAARSPDTLLNLEETTHMGN